MNPTDIEGVIEGIQTLEVEELSVEGDRKTKCSLLQVPGSGS